MAFKLTKDELKKRDELVAALREQRGNLENAVSTFNDALASAKEDLETAQTNYNEALSSARDFCEGIAVAGNDAFDEKSEKWQEGENGDAARSFIDEWENVSLDDVEITMPEDVEFSDDDHADTIEQLPEEK